MKQAQTEHGNKATGVWGESSMRGMREDSHTSSAAMGRAAEREFLFSSQRELVHIGFGAYGPTTNLEQCEQVVEQLMKDGITLDDINEMNAFVFALSEQNQVVFTPEFKQALREGLGKTAGTMAGVLTVSMQTEPNGPIQNDMLITNNDEELDGIAADMYAAMQANTRATYAPGNNEIKVRPEGPDAPGRRPGQGRRP